LSHLLAAESAQTLQDQAAREVHFNQALLEAARPDALGAREALQLRAARWALEDHDAHSALRWLDDLPQGAARRTIALRLRLQAARMALNTRQALETARLLGKHRAFSKLATERILRGLALELVTTAHDPDQLATVWGQMDAVERAMPEVAVSAAQRLLRLGGDFDLALQWLLPVWDVLVAQPDALSLTQRISVIQTLELCFTQAAGAPESGWLTRVEQAQRRYPGDAHLQYLSGIACMRLQLWGKAQQLLRQSLPRLRHPGLERTAWLALAELAERREDTAGALDAWKKAASYAIA
jgi:HemY protein